MPRIKLTKHEKQSKGRNGWFSPAEIAVLHGPLDTVAVEVWSKRQTGEAPIDLYLTAKDALQVGKALVEMADGELQGHAFTSEQKAALIAQAKEQYAMGSDDDVEIDADARFSAGEGGTWVSSWVWVADAEVDEAICAVCGHVESSHNRLPRSVVATCEGACICDEFTANEDGNNA